MAEDEQREPAAEPGEPSLELPSLRSAFRRKKPRKNRAHPSASRAVLPRFSQQEEEPRRSPAPLVTTPAAPPLEDEPAPEPKRRREPKPIRLRVPGPVAALLTGAAVGLALVGLTSASLHLCTTWRGTSSCGSPGILLLLAMVVV